jgi:acyl-CoA oxidase
LTPIRDQSTHETFEGCLVGDCGDKIGLQGIDNGWVKFTNYKLPKDLLLNKFADVTDEGKYISSIPSSSKRFGNHMAALSGGRVLAAGNATDSSILSSITAIRYGACRRQFSRKKGEEEAFILDYPLHQARIMPHFAQGFLESITMQGVWDEYTEKSSMLLDPSNKAGEYFHLVSSAMKAVCTWDAYDAWRESRLACGGLGYHALNNFGQLGETADVNQTWEGENYVLIQQACKLLLKNFSNLIRGKDSMKT